MGSEEFSHFFSFFFRFSSFFFSLFFAFLSFFAYSPGTRANDCNLLGKWEISLRPRLHRPRIKWPRHCRKGYWTKMDQNGPDDHFGQNDLISNWILAFARPNWPKMDHFGPLWSRERSVLVHLGPPTVLCPFLKIAIKSCDFQVVLDGAPGRGFQLLR